LTNKRKLERFYKKKGAKFVYHLFELAPLMMTKEVFDISSVLFTDNPFNTIEPDGNITGWDAALSSYEADECGCCVTRYGYDTGEIRAYGIYVFIDKVTEFTLSVYNDSDIKLFNGNIIDYFLHSLAHTFFHELYHICDNNNKEIINHIDRYDNDIEYNTKTENRVNEKASCFMSDHYDEIFNGYMPDYKGVIQEWHMYID